VREFKITTHSTIPPVLIFGIGNESRGDDALGHLLLRNLDAWLASQGLSEQFELLEEFQLQIEHAMDMKDRRLVLFIDAGMDTRTPYTFYRTKMSAESVLYSHALAPAALLKAYQQFYQQTPPTAFVLCIRGERFELGDPLTPQAEAHLLAAQLFVRQLMLEPQAETWDRQCIQQTTGSVIRSVHGNNS